MWFFWDDKDTKKRRFTDFQPIHIGKLDSKISPIHPVTPVTPVTPGGTPQLWGFYSCTRTAWWKSKTAIPGRRPICSQHLGVSGGHKKWAFRWFSWWMKSPNQLYSKHQEPAMKHHTGWWFQTFFIFHNIWDNSSHWLIFFRGVETTNQHTIG